MKGAPRRAISKRKGPEKLIDVVEQNHTILASSSNSRLPGFWGILSSYLVPVMMLDYPSFPKMNQ